MSAWKNKKETTHRCAQQTRKQNTPQAGIAILLLYLCLFFPGMGLADGGSPTITPAGYLAVTPTGGQSSSFEIIIAPSASPEINRMEPNLLVPGESTAGESTTGESANLPNPQELSVQPPDDIQTPPAEEKFDSPLWLFFFMFVVLVIVMLNAIGNRLRQKRSS
jgi:hypothetical protein